MVRKNSEKIIDEVDNKFGAPGHITVRNLINTRDELNDKGRCWAHTTVLPHSGIGYHEHHGESELYYFYSGKGEFNDNGTIVPIEAGDVTITYDGQGHGVNNPYDEPLEIIALILDK